MFDKLCVFPFSFCPLITGGRKFETGIIIIIITISHLRAVNTKSKMGSKEMSLVLLMMAVVVAAAATPSGIKSINVVGRIEDENEMSMPTEESRRHLNAGQDCISYDAMLANKVPCSLKGHSYYDCHNRTGSGPVNPYRRECSTSTNCERSTS